MGKGERWERAWDYAYRQLEAVGGNPIDLPEPLQVVIVISSVQGVIDNGGFNYLFENNFPHQQPYPYYSNLYRLIGAHEVADAFDRAVAVFPFSDPHLDPERRLEYMENWTVFDSDSLFHEMTNRVCGAEEVWELLGEYTDRTLPEIK